MTVSQAASKSNCRHFSIENRIKSSTEGFSHWRRCILLLRAAAHFVMACFGVNPLPSELFIVDVLDF